MAKTDQEIAQDLWPGQAKPLTESDIAGEVAAGQERVAQVAKSDAEIASVLWPSKNENLAPVGEGERVHDVLRDDTGRIIASGDWSGQRDRLLQSKGAYADAVAFENETISVEVRDASVRGGSFDGTAFSPGTGLINSDCRRASFRRATLKGASLAGSDLRGCQFGDADIAGCDFAGCQIDQEAWDSLRNARGFREAKNLGRPPFEA
jgi:hypothetical protein